MLIEQAYTELYQFHNTVSCALETAVDWPVQTEEARPCEAEVSLGPAVGLPLLWTPFSSDIFLYGSGQITNSQSCHCVRRLLSRMKPHSQLWLPEDREWNPLIFRGKTAAQTAALDKDDLLQLKSTDIKKTHHFSWHSKSVAVTQNSQQPKEVTSQVAASISAIWEYTKDIQICAVITAPNSRISESAYQRFVLALEDKFKAARIIYVHAGCETSDLAAALSCVL